MLVTAVQCTLQMRYRKGYRRQGSRAALLLVLCWLRSCKATSSNGIQIEIAILLAGVSPPHGIVLHGAMDVSAGIYIRLK